MMHNVSVPFKITDVYEGFAETDGIILFADDSIKLQFQTKDAIFGAIKSNVKEIILPLQAIQDMHLRKGLWRHALIIRVSDLKLLEQIPKQKAGEMKLKIRRRDADLALSLVSNVKLEMTNLSLKYLKGQPDE